MGGSINGNRIKHVRLSGYKDDGSPLQIITINVPRKVIKMIEYLVMNGFGASRSEIIRSLLSEFLPVKIKQWKGLIDACEIEEEEEEEEGTVRVPNGDGTYKTHRIMRTA